ncbi:unnamed protein product, partial [Didymodactylos carnosus]
YNKTDINGINVALMPELTKELKRQLHQQKNRMENENDSNIYSKDPSLNDEVLTPLIDDFISKSHYIPNADKTTDYLDIVRENPSNCVCADCSSPHPTIAIMSWIISAVESLPFWKENELKFPNLSLLARLLFSIPATSTGVERQFSAAGFVINERHVSLNPETVEDILLVRSVQKILEQKSTVHRRLTCDFLSLQSLLTVNCDPDLIELLKELGNEYSNGLLEHSSFSILKPNEQSSDYEREQYVKEKYINKNYLRPLDDNINSHHQYDLDRLLYENVETNDYRLTLQLLMHGANPNYFEKMFSVTDHAKRHQQIKQMKLVYANGGQSEYNLMKNTNSTYETTIHLSSRGVLKEFLTKFESDILRIHSTTNDKRCFTQIDLNNVSAICNQSYILSNANKSRLPPTCNSGQTCQSTLIVDDRGVIEDYKWIFPNEIERALWIRELLKRQYTFHQLIYSDFILLTKLSVQEGINSEEQQATAIVYPARFVICSDTLFDEVDLRKYCSLTYQKNDEFTGIVLCLVSNRFLYLSSSIPKLTDMLFGCLKEAIKVKSLNDLRGQILTSQNVPVIIERFINFIFEHGLETKGIYRQAGQESKVKQLLQECLEDPFNTSLTYENYTEHDVANGLKRFFRQLKQSILGTKRNYDCWLRSTVLDKSTASSNEQLIQYYRGLLSEMKKHMPVNYYTLRKVLMHLRTVALLSDKNGMSLDNLISIFAPCLISGHEEQMTTTIPSQPIHFQYSKNNSSRLEDLNVDDEYDKDEHDYMNLDKKLLKPLPKQDNFRLINSSDETTDSRSLIYTSENSPTIPPRFPIPLRRNQSLQSM